MALDLSWLPAGPGSGRAGLRGAAPADRLACSPLHLPAIVIYAMATGHSFDEGLLHALGGRGPARRRPRARARACGGASRRVWGCWSAPRCWCTQSGGLIEMHFHYFVAVAVIALYQEWLVYATAILFVLRRARRARRDRPPVRLRPRRQPLDARRRCTPASSAPWRSPSSPSGTTRSGRGRTRSTTAASSTTARRAWSLGSRTPPSCAPTSSAP